LRLRRPPASPLFPYTTLFRSDHRVPGPVEEDRVALRLRREELEDGARGHGAVRQHLVLDCRDTLAQAHGLLVALGEQRLQVAAQDRKSTRLNSSHVSISYAVF